MIPQHEQTLKTDGQLAVWRSRDGGATWTGATAGLPAGTHSLLRDAMATDAHAETGVYFGTTTGNLFASTDAGQRWTTLSTGLSRTHAVEVGRL